MLDALPAATLQIYSGFGQAPSMPDCIPSGLGSNSQLVLWYIGREHLWSQIYDHNTKYSNDHELYMDGADG